MMIKWLSIVLLAHGVLLHAQLKQRLMHVTPDGTAGAVLTVGGYVPLKDTIDYLNHEYGWRVSYEDSLYSSSQVEDIAVVSWRKTHPGERGFYVPKWAELKFRLSTPSGQKGEQAKILSELIQQYNQLQREDKFSLHVVSENRAIVVGNSKGVEVMGHARVLPRKQERNGSEEMRLLAEECGGQMQMRLVVGTVPFNSLAHITVPVRKTSVSCRDAFEALTERIGGNFVYQVMEDVTDEMFVVSIIPNQVVVRATP